MSRNSDLKIWDYPTPPIHIWDFPQIKACFLTASLTLTDNDSVNASLLVMTLTQGHSPGTITSKQGHFGKRWSTEVRLAHHWPLWYLKHRSCIIHTLDNNFVSYHVSILRIADKKEFFCPRILVVNATVQTLMWHLRPWPWPRGT